MAFMDSPGQGTMTLIGLVGCVCAIAAIEERVSANAASNAFAPHSTAVGGEFVV
jgi:hypothetical protein